MKYLNIKKALAAWQNLQPLSEKDRDRLSRRFTVDFNYNSNHIEGNTLTYHPDLWSDRDSFVIWKGNRRS